MEQCNDRRSFIKKAAFGTAGVAMGMSAKSYGRILGANDRVSVGILGYSGHARGALIPAFYKSNKKLNFKITGVCDLWNLR